MKQVGGTMVNGGMLPFVPVYTGGYSTGQVGGKLIGKMDYKVIFLFGIQHRVIFSADGQDTCIAYLAAAFGIKRRFVEYYLVRLPALCLYFPVFQDMGF